QSLAHSPQEIGSDLAAALEEAFRCDKSVAHAGEAGEVFINVFHPNVRLIIVGAVHIAQQLVPMACSLGHDVVIIDPRTAFATEGRFADSHASPEWPDHARTR